MIRKIICKEILENFLSFRFILSLVLIGSLFAISGSVFIGKYHHDSQDYWKKTNENLSALNEQSKQLYKLAFYEQKIWRKPKPFSLCTEGFEKFLPNCFMFNLFTINLPEARAQSNFILPHFSDIDWVFIISSILSFVALIFTYNSICGERETGTLRLMLAGSIPRHKILLGKYFSLILILGVPLFLGLIVNLVIVVSSNVVVIDADGWLKILAIVFLSLLYLSIFILLGMFISSRTTHSANCMVVLLLVWVVLVILIPSFGRIVSDIFYKIPTRTELDRMIIEAKRDIWNDPERFGKNANYMSPNIDDPSNNPSARARYLNALTESRNRIVERHLNQITAQAVIGRRFTSISPTVVYQRASEAIAGTGINRCINVHQQIRRYQEDFTEYIRSKDREDPDSLHLIFDGEANVKSWGAMSKKPVVFDTVPKFQEKNPALLESLRLIIWDIGILVLFNLVLFFASFISFLRYDVR